MKGQHDVGALAVLPYVQPVSGDRLFNGFAAVGGYEEVVDGLGDGGSSFSSGKETLGNDAWLACTHPTSCFTEATIIAMVASVKQLVGRVRYQSIKPP